MAVSSVTIQINPLAVARLAAPGGIVDIHLSKLATAVAVAARGFAPHDTGKLAASIHIDRIGPSAWAVKATAPYAAAVHEGSRPHEIRPHGKVLRFPTRGGGIVFAPKVQHPGTRPNPFLERAMTSVIGRSLL